MSEDAAGRLPSPRKSDYGDDVEGPGSAQTQDTPGEETACWVCGGPVTERHCKIVCQVCGFTRDCSDP